MTEAKTDTGARLVTILAAEKLAEITQRAQAAIDAAHAKMEEWRHRRRTELVATLDPHAVFDRPPPPVDDVEAYWTDPPPDLSQRCRYWHARMSGGFVPNRRIRAMGYYEASRWYGVYIWEYLNVLR